VPRRSNFIRRQRCKRSSSVRNAAAVVRNALHNFLAHGSLNCATSFQCRLKSRNRCSASGWVSVERVSRRVSSRSAISLTVETACWKRRFPRRRRAAHRRAAASPRRRRRRGGNAKSCSACNAPSRASTSPAIRQFRRRVPLRAKRRACREFDRGLAFRFFSQRRGLRDLGRFRELGRRASRSSWASSCKMAALPAVRAPRGGLQLDWKNLFSIAPARPSRGVLGLSRTTERMIWSACASSREVTAADNPCTADDSR